MSESSISDLDPMNFRDKSKEEMYHVQRIMLRALLVLVYFLSPGSAYPSKSCRCMPTDACWPTSDEWTKFNVSLGGKLLATTPLASPCHEPSYNATECRYLQSQWTLPQLQ